VRPRGTASSMPCTLKPAGISRKHRFRLYLPCRDYPPPSACVCRNPSAAAEACAAAHSRTSRRCPSPRRMNPDSHDRDIGGCAKGNLPGACRHNKAKGRSARRHHPGIEAPVPRRIARRQVRETAIATKERIADAPWNPPSHGIGRLCGRIQEIASNMCTAPCTATASSTLMEKTGKDIY